MTPSLGYLLCRNEGLSSEPQNSCEKPHTASSTKEADTGGTLGLAGQPVGLISEFHTNEKPYLKKKIRLRVVEEDTFNFWSPHACTLISHMHLRMCTHRDTHMDTCMHAHTLQCGDALKTLCQAKQANPRRTRNTQIHYMRFRR